MLLSLAGWGECYSTFPPSPLTISLRVEGGELFDRVVSVGKFSESVGKLLFYQMLDAVKVTSHILYHSPSEM